MTNKKTSHKSCKIRRSPWLCFYWYTRPCCLLQKQPVCFQWWTSWRAKQRRWTCGAVWLSRCFLPGRHTSRWTHGRPARRKPNSQKRCPTSDTITLLLHLLYKLTVKIRNDWIGRTLWLHLVVQMNTCTPCWTLATNKSLMYNSK